MESEIHKVLLSLDLFQKQPTELADAVVMKILEVLGYQLIKKPSQYFLQSTQNGQD